MPAADLPSLETRLEACLIELERLHQVRPSLPDALGRAGAGQRIDELLDEIAELQQEIILSPAVTLQDAAVKIRRLSVYTWRIGSPRGCWTGRWRPWRGPSRRLCGRA